MALITAAIFMRFGRAPTTQSMGAAATREDINLPPSWLTRRSAGASSRGSSSITSATSLPVNACFSSRRPQLAANNRSCSSMYRVRFEYSSPASGEKDSRVRLKAYSLYRRRCCGALGGQVHRQHDFLVEQRRRECACCTADLWNVTAGTECVARSRESWCSPLFEP